MMNKIKHSKYNLKQIFQDAVENKRKGVKIEYIWLNKCEKCHSNIPVLDEEYSFEYTSENELSVDKLLNALNDFIADYSVFEDMYEEELHAFEYIGLDEYENAEVYYYYREDETTRELCNVCSKVF